MKIAVLGATGHTGRFVVAELLRRRLSPIAIGRDREKLAAGNVPAFCIPDFADAAALDKAVAGTAAIVNCAGPFFDTATPAIAAALRNKITYIDVTAEQITALTSFHRYHEAAMAAGIAILPALAFYGGLADLLATAAMEGWQEAERLTVAIALDSWHPTEGTRQTGARNTAPRYVLRNGSFAVLDPAAPPVAWKFAEPFGEQETAEVPLAEVITISRHLAVADIVSLMNLTPLKDLRDPKTPPPAAADPRGRSAQRFAMEVAAERDGAVRKLTLSGRDIYAVSAELVAEAALWLCQRKIRETGTLAAGMALDPRAFLDALCKSSDDLVLTRA